jgi:asparagine synthase (glutamine-hydrolysing)
MCGIVGLKGDFPREAAGRIVSRMNETIRHRGPDDEGTWAEDGFAFGMRRLSIIDLALGHQPMATADGARQIVFNGEIYNFKDLRQELVAQGHTFATASDTEVILRQYEQDGPDCVNRLNGMFAFAIWDRDAGRLFLARDRLGVKPLYYYWDGRNFLFASEIKALLASELVPREINLQALWDYLTFRYVPQPETIWQKVHKLPPGHALTVTSAQPQPVIRRYWDIPYTDNLPVKSQADYEEEFDSLFVDAVRLRLIADVPVGVLLSGGLDSSAVAAAISEVHNARLSSFSVAFSDSSAIDERPFARKVAEHVGLDHHEIVIGEREVRDFLPRVVYFTDERSPRRLPYGPDRAKLGAPEAISAAACVAAPGCCLEPGTPHGRPVGETHRASQYRPRSAIGL